jgi:hypothetical protein
MLMFRRAGGMVTVAALAAIGLAACGSGSSPHVAGLARSGDTAPGSTTTLPKGNPTQLLDEWASCMRAHGTPGVADPTIDSNGVIHITLPSTDGGPQSLGSGGDLNGGGPCGAYLTAASTALRGGQPLQKPNPAKLLKYSECMQANGIPDFPDPNSSGGLQIRVSPGSDLDPNNPAFQKASKLCAKKTGVPGVGGAGPQRGGVQITSTGTGGPATGPGGKSTGGAGIASSGAGSGSGS